MTSGRARTSQPPQQTIDRPPPLPPPSITAQQQQQHLTPSSSVNSNSRRQTITPLPPHAERNRSFPTQSRMSNSGDVRPSVGHRSTAARRTATNLLTTTMTTSGTTGGIQALISADDVDNGTQSHRRRKQPPLQPIHKASAYDASVDDISESNVPPLASALGDGQHHEESVPTKTKAGRHARGVARMETVRDVNPTDFENSMTSLRNATSGVSRLENTEVSLENMGRHDNADSQFVVERQLAHVELEALIARSSKSYNCGVSAHAALQVRTETAAATLTSGEDELPESQCRVNVKKTSDSPGQQRVERTDRTESIGDECSSLRPSVEETGQALQLETGPEDNTSAFSAARSVLDDEAIPPFHSEPSRAAKGRASVDCHLVRETIAEHTCRSSPVSSHPELKIHQSDSCFVQYQSNESNCGMLADGGGQVDQSDEVSSGVCVGRGLLHPPFVNGRISKTLAMKFVAQILDNIETLQTAIGTVIEETTPPIDDELSNTAKAEDAIESSFEGSRLRSAISGNRPGSAVSSSALKALGLAIAATIETLEQTTLAGLSHKVNSPHTMSAGTNRADETTSDNLRTDTSGLVPGVSSVSTQTDRLSTADELQQRSRESPVVGLFPDSPRRVMMRLPYDLVRDFSDDDGSGQVEQGLLSTGGATDNKSYHVNEDDGNSMHPNVGECTSDSQWSATTAEEEDSSTSSSSSSSSSLSSSSPEESPRSVSTTVGVSSFRLVNSQVVPQRRNAENVSPSSMMTSFEMQASDALNYLSNYSEQHENGSVQSSMRYENGVQQISGNDPTSSMFRPDNVSDGGVERDIDAMIDDHLFMFNEAARQQQEQIGDHGWQHSTYDGAELLGSERHLRIEPRHSIFVPGELICLFR